MPTRKRRHRDELSEIIEAGVDQRLTDAFTRALGTPRGLPEGVVTVLFTDVEDSTGLVDRLGDERARAVLRHHDELLRKVISDHCGTEVERTGDSFMVAFSSVRGAIGCALDMQRLMAGAAPNDTENAVRIRIGMDTGDVLPQERGYFGKTVFRASRITEFSTPGRVVVSEVTRMLAGDHFGFRDLGTHRLKGLRDATRLFEAVPEAAV
jgi:class 3 adenylate cyclase